MDIGLKLRLDLSSETFQHYVASHLVEVEEQARAAITAAVANFNFEQEVYSQVKEAIREAVADAAKQAIRRAVWSAMDGGAMGSLDDIAKVEVYRQISSLAERAK